MKYFKEILSVDTGFPLRLGEMIEVEIDVWLMSSYSFLSAVLGAGYPLALPEGVPRRGWRPVGSTCSSVTSGNRDFHFNYIKLHVVLFYFIILEKFAIHRKIVKTVPSAP